jgi:hypothetical protein
MDTVVQSYEHLYKRFAPTFGAVPTDIHAVIATSLRSKWKMIQFSEPGNSERTYCLALLICLKYQALNRKYSDIDTIAALLLACRITKHSCDKCDEAIYNNIAVPKAVQQILTTLDGQLYIPSAITFFDLVQGYYYMIDIDNIELVRRSLSCAYASSACLSISPYDLAIAAIAYWKHDSSINKVAILDKFHYCLLTSPLSIMHLPRGYVSSYTPTNTTAVDELKVSLTSLPAIVSYGHNIISLPEVVHEAIHSEQSVVYKRQQTMNAFTIEVVLMSSLQHINIQSIIRFNVLTSIIETPIEPGNLALIIRSFNEQSVPTYCTDKDPLAFVDKAGVVIDRHQRSRNYTRQLLHGVAYLHSNGILHGNINPENVLITSDNVLKITDFGTSMTFMNSMIVRGPFYTDISINKYQAPELSTTLMLKHEYSTEVDMWSCGIIMYELQGRRWESETIDELTSNINKLFGSKSNLQRMTTGINRDIATVIMQCCNLNPQLRITAKQALVLTE